MKYQHPSLSSHPSHLLAEGTYEGFQWAILHNGMGFRCGYVAVPPGHPWHGKGYDEVRAEAHGGLTYANANAEDGSHWLGFYCAHYGDAQDPDLPNYDTMRSFSGCVRSQEYVEQECRSLCEQAAQAK